LSFRGCRSRRARALDPGKGRPSRVSDGRDFSRSGRSTVDRPPAWSGVSNYAAGAPHAATQHALDRASARRSQSRRSRQDHGKRRSWRDVRRRDQVEPILCRMVVQSGPRRSPSTTSRVHVTLLLVDWESSFACGQVVQSGADSRRRR
jgi:hypothetical protein